ncbi:MAG: succinate--CoA ligase subunit alpha [Nitrosopumilaceae archaeon]|nr:succinate--CoA ligase subunit alpha [Nitrosopumilaceae archaeon]
MLDIFDILVGTREDNDYKNKSVIIQGITGKFGSLHTKNMIAYGTNIVAGVTPGKGETKFENINIYDTMREAVRSTNSKISVMFMPAKFFLEAAEDAINAGIKLLIAIPEHVPIKDTMIALKMARKNKAAIIGPNTPGIIIPDVIKLGIMPTTPFKPGNIAILSKSGTLMYEMSDKISQHGFGQNIAIGIGGDPINGTILIDAFDMIKDSPKLDGIVVVGEIGGDAEEILAQHVMDINYKKPIISYIAGRSAPKEKRMGHAGAIVYGEYGSAESKIKMFNNANIPVAKKPSEIPILLAQRLKI